jgi:hypothetical protein
VAFSGAVRNYAKSGGTGPGQFRWQPPDRVVERRMGPVLDESIDALGPVPQCAVDRCSSSLPNSSGLETLAPAAGGRVREC